MKMILGFSAALMLTAGCFMQTCLSAGDKKGPDKKADPPKEVVVKDELLTTDLKDKVRTQHYCKTYVYKMIEGRNYQLDMIAAFDSYLRLENSEGVQVAADDDGGGFPNARIMYRAPKSGDYTIICTTFGGGATGKFTLVVQDLTGGAAPKEEKKDGEKKDKIQQEPRPEKSGFYHIAPRYRTAPLAYSSGTSLRI